MKKIALQISPEAKAAYFADYLTVAMQELQQVCNDVAVTHTGIGSLEFFELEADSDIVDKLLRLSFVQGVYAIEGELLRPLDLRADFRLHEDFVFGSKYKGKTNERLTQMLINVALAAIDTKDNDKIKLLDPMCGRGTTLLWAMRYGIKSKGIEQDAKALPEIHRHLKKWTKLHRQKHKMTEGYIGAANKKKSTGRFLEFSAEGTTMQVITADARQADQVLKQEKFDLIVSDLPYGVQHQTTERTRDPLAVIAECVEAWKNCLKKEGAIVLSFNRYNPKRTELIDVFSNAGFEANPFTIEHRMSESIVRDVVILKQTRSK